MPSRLATTLGAVALASSLLSTGCITRPITEDVFQEGGTQVFLRSDKRLTQILEKNYDHPATISDVRISHILSRFDLRDDAKKGSRRAAIPTATLYEIADGVSQALAKASPDQEVVVLSIRRSKRFGIFDRKYLTSFVSYVKGDELYVHLSRSEWEVAPRRDDRLPQPRIGEHPESFRLYPDHAMIAVDPQSLAVKWRNPKFRKPSRTKVTATGAVVRKTILMESAVDEEETGAPASPLGFPEGLSPTQYRQLADLEEARRAGLITEGQFLSRREEILEASP